VFYFDFKNRQQEVTDKPFNKFSSLLEQEYRTCSKQKLINGEQTEL